MQTECTSEKLALQGWGRRDLIAEFNGGTITSDGGVLLLKQVEAKRKIIKQFALCFTDHRDPDKIEHSIEDLVAQQVYGLALGYEDLNDHNLLRRDPLELRSEHLEKGANSDRMQIERPVFERTVADRGVARNDPTSR